MGQATRNSCHTGQAIRKQ
jgi:hypothetical protein